MLKKLFSFSSALNRMSKFFSRLNFFNNDFSCFLLFYSFFFACLSVSLSLSPCSPERSSCSRRNSQNLIMDLFYSRRQSTIKGGRGRGRESTETGLCPSIRSLLAANADLTSGNAAALKYKQFFMNDKMVVSAKLSLKGRT